MRPDQGGRDAPTAALPASGSTAAHVRKGEILRDQKTVAGLSGLPDFLVGLSCKVFRPHRVNVVAQLA